MQRLRHVYLGTAATDDGEQVKGELVGWSPFLCFEKVGADLERRTAALLAAGSVVGWVQGRAEFGPRALGNRSILADPRPAENKDRINFMVKKREGYRPFAPAVIERSADTYFELPSSETDLGFMTFVVKVKADQRELLGAVTHVDGTARIQTVSPETNPRFHRLIEEFGALTGVPILLNTSFNNNAEPIVNTAGDAIVCYLTTGIDYLVLGDYLVHSKVDFTADPQRSLDLQVSMRPPQRLVRTFARSGGAIEYAIHTAAPMKEWPVPCSADMFLILSRLPCAASLRSIAEELGLPAASHADIAREALALWQERLIDLHP